jgi:hypothetical protein
LCVSEGGKVIFNEFLTPDGSDVVSTSRGVMGVELEIYGARIVSFWQSDQILGHHRRQREKEHTGFFGLY